MQEIGNFNDIFFSFYKNQWKTITVTVLSEIEVGVKTENMWRMCGGINRFAKIDRGELKLRQKSAQDVVLTRRLSVIPN